MIYVDSLRSCIPNPKWRWNKSCHLFADSLEELHEFALKLGLKRSYFQSKSIVPHYDLTENKRREAVMKGAREVKNAVRKLPGTGGYIRKNPAHFFKNGCCQGLIEIPNSHKNPKIVIH